MTHSSIISLMVGRYGRSLINPCSSAKAQKGQQNPGSTGATGSRMLAQLHCCQPWEHRLPASTLPSSSFIILPQGEQELQGTLLIVQYPFSAEPGGRAGMVCPGMKSGLVRTREKRGLESRIGRKSTEEGKLWACWEGERQNASILQAQRSRQHGTLYL